jgi:quercetin dioxygenase-like cupin family protein
MPQGKEAIELGGITVQFLVESGDSNGSATVFRCELPAAAQVPVPHSHDGFEETVYGLSGVTTWTVDGVPMQVGPGDALCIPRGAVHGFEVSGDEDASVLFVASPGLFGPDYFREIAAVVKAAAGGPPDKDELMAVMKRHGLTPAVPAPA